MYRIYKYETENLNCYYEDGKYYIYEIPSGEIVAIYINQNNMKLSSKIPENPTEYKYFEELKKIINEIY